MFREPKTGSNKWCLRGIRAHQGTSRCINCVLLYRACFCKKDMQTHAYTSLDQLVQNADRLVAAKKRIEGVHHGASVAHHDASRFTLDTICSIPFSFPRYVPCCSEAAFGDSLCLVVLGFRRNLPSRRLLTTLLFILMARFCLVCSQNLFVLMVGLASCFVLWILCSFWRVLWIRIILRHSH